MKALEFPQMTVKIAEHQEQYETLPAHVTPDGVVITCFELDEEELAQVVDNGKIYISIHTFGEPLQPIGMSVLNPWQNDKVKPKDIIVGPPSLGYTLCGTKVQKGVMGILYLCKFNKDLLELTVTGERFYRSKYAAIEDYGNIPNPESQLIIGDNYTQLCNNLMVIHERMNNTGWLEALKESL